jgi:hypothetical protein
MMPFGVDVLGTLSEKLKQLTNEAKDHYSSFTDLTKLYKQEKIKRKISLIRFSIMLSRPQL